MSSGCSAPGPRGLLCAEDCEVTITCWRGRCAVKRARGLSADDLDPSCAVPLPPPAPAHDIVLGVDEHGVPFGLRLEDVWRHVGVLGSTGSGKTTTAAILVRELYVNRVPTIVLDWAGEYPLYLARLRVDYEVLTDKLLPAVSIVSEKLDVELVLDTLRHALSLSAHQVTALHMVLGLVVGLPVAAAQHMLRLDAEGGRRLSEALKVVERDNSIVSLLNLVKTVWELVVRADVIGGYSRSEAEVWAALARRLAMIAFSRYSWLFRVRGSGVHDLVSLAREKRVPVVVDLSSIPSPRVKRVYAALLLGNLFDYAVARGPLGLVVVVEEAHNVLEHAQALFEHLLAEARKYMLGLILVSSKPSALTASMIANLGTIIVHQLRAPPRTLPGLDLADAERLGVGEAYVVTGSAEPVKVALTP